MHEYGESSESTAHDAALLSLSTEMVAAVEDDLADHHFENVIARTEDLHAADVADLLEAVRPDLRELLVGVLRPRLYRQSEILTYLDDSLSPDIMRLLDPEKIAQGLVKLESDDVLALIERLDPASQQEILDCLPLISRRYIEEGLSFPEYSAGRLMQRDFVAVPMFWTVGRVIDYLRSDAALPEDFYQIIIVDPLYRPVGRIPLSRILRASRAVKIDELALAKIHTLPATLDQEEVAFRFRQYGLVLAPVVSESGRLLGVITVDDVVEVIDEEAEDDLLKLGGVSAGDMYRAVIGTGVSRFRWLFINLATAILASAVIALFDATIEQLVALAVLMPIVASMGGNAGTQSLTIAVRALAMKQVTHRNSLRLLWKEFLVGGFNGIIFAALSAILVLLWFQDGLLALVIALAMAVNLLVAGLTGSLVPLVLERLKIDPAIASSVVLTTVTDVVGFLVFLGLGAWLLL